VDQTQTLRYISRFEPLLYVPTFTQKDFHYVHTGPSTGTSTEELQLYTESTQLHSLKHKPLHKRWALSQSKEKVYNLVIQ